MNDKYGALLTGQDAEVTRFGTAAKQVTVDADTDNSGSDQKGYIYALKAINGNVVFSQLEFRNGNDLTSADRLLEGDVLYGDISSFTLTSGVVLIYGRNFTIAP